MPSAVGSFWVHIHGLRRNRHDPPFGCSSARSPRPARRSDTLRADTHVSSRLLVVALVSALPGAAHHFAPPWNTGAFGRANACQSPWRPAFTPSQHPLPVVEMRSGESAPDPCPRSDGRNPEPYALIRSFHPRGWERPGEGCMPSSPVTATEHCGKNHVSLTTRGCPTSRLAAHPAASIIAARSPLPRGPGKFMILEVMLAGSLRYYRA
jgi:hypothetical protein